MPKTLCDTGAEQSPINIISKISKKCSATCDLTFFYKTSKLNMSLYKNDLVIDYDTGSYINFNQEIFELDKISFTNPSSHKIDNVSYPIEAHLYHRNPYTGKILIIAVFIDINEAISNSKRFLDSISPFLPKIKANEISANTEENWNIYSIIPEVKGFFLYTGSIVKNPCTEDILWLIFDEPVNCSKNLYNNLKKISNKNARSIKNLGERPIYYNLNNSKKNLRNYGKETMCYSKIEFEKKCKTYIKQNQPKIINIYIFKFLLIILLTIIIIFLFNNGTIQKYYNYMINPIKNILKKKIINQ